MLGHFGCFYLQPLSIMPDFLLGGSRFEMTKHNLSLAFSFHMKAITMACCISSCLFNAGCYGVDPASVSKDWKCARCRANAMTEVRALVVGSA